MRLMIGTPAYSGLVHVDYANSLLEYQNANIDFELATIDNESLITRGRNTIISCFYAQREMFTHLFFMDADIGMSADGLKKLLSYNKDVMGAPVPLKGFWPDGSPRLNIGQEVKNVGNNLFTTDKLGTAVFILSRKAVESLVEKAIAEGNVYKNAVGLKMNGQASDITMYDIFRTGAKNKKYLAEDFWVCEDLTTLGYDIHISDSVMVTHHGMHAFKPQVDAIK